MVPIALDGTLGSWAPVTPLPATRTTHSSFLHGLHLYVVGGFGPAGELASVQRARLLPEQTLGPWEDSIALPFARTHNHYAPVSGDRVFSIGGSLSGASQPEAFVGTLR